MFAFFKKYLYAIASLIAVVSFITLAQNFNDSEKSSNELIIGLQSGYPPFEFIDADGKIVGFDVEVAAHIASQLGKTLVIKEMEFDAEILSLKQGKIDLIISGMDITPSRLKEIAMIPYHGEASAELSLLFWEKIPEGIHSLEDMAVLSNPIVSVESGTTPEKCLKHYPHIQIKTFQGAFDPLMDVKFGKSTACLVGSSVAQYLQQTFPEVKIVTIPLPEEETVLGCGIGIKKDNVAFQEQVQAIIQDFKASGELHQLEEKWFKQGGTNVY